jgi:predicted AlkP superfamily pyrophosphatase or phosphodiesterase
MRRKPLIFLIFFVFLFAACKFRQTGEVKRPKLVVGLVIDQMRWDYLYRYYDRYGEGGFKRLLKKGFNCDNTLINYLPSFTAVGHASIFTGSIPAFTGITGNDWINQSNGQRVYCTEDSTVKSVGAEDPESREGKMSPRNLLVSTITDELKIASNFTSKVVGVSLKDRAAILPAGHVANGAFWLDDSTGHFITSSFYMTSLPAWADVFNKKDPVKEMVRNKWTTLYPISSYGRHSDMDEQVYEGKFKGDLTTGFPHNLAGSYDSGKASFRNTPFGNTLTLDFAKAAVEGYHLGEGDQTDFLTVNCASADYVGHMFGINSIEIEDTYLRLDQELAKFFQFLDDRYGKNGYLLFLTADHGAAHAVGFLQNHDIPADFWFSVRVTEDLNKSLYQKFRVDSLVDTISNYQVNFAKRTIETHHLDYEAVKKAAVDWLRDQPGINYAIDMDRVYESNLPEPVRSMIQRGYNSRRSGPIQVIPNPGWFDARGRTGTTHGTWNPYDTHIPLVFMGWGIHSGHTEEPVFMTDIAPTVAALLHIQMPNGCVGKPISELFKK